MNYVPFNGNAPAVNTLLGGHIDTLMDNYSVVAENIKAGRLRPLAVGSRARSETDDRRSDVAESGYPDYEVSVWYGLLAPSATPSTVVDQLSQWCKAAMLAPELQPTWDQQGLRSDWAIPRLTLLRTYASSKSSTVVRTARLIYSPRESASSH